MCAANMALCVFFGLKNTPLAYITPISHAQLNIFHRIAGYTAVLLVLLHAIFYTIHFGRQGRWANMVKQENLEGIGAGISMLALLMGVLRHRSYEIFYVSHIVGFVAAVVLTSLHRPNWAKKLPVLMLFIATLWVADRVLRAARITYNLVNNTATFYSLPGGGTRLLLKKPGIEVAPPGAHCFLWIPRIHLFQSHPFTIVSNGPSGLELVMKSRKGFTKTVGNFAARYPRCTAWASVDGPYTSCPNTESYDKLILIAGGSGAAFTVGLMNRILSQSERPIHQSIEFVWAVKRAVEQLSWFSEHLRNLSKAGSGVSVRLYVTSEDSVASPSLATYSDVESGVQPEMERSLSSKTGFANYGSISEVCDTDALLGGTDWDAVTFTRMDIEMVIGKAMGTSKSCQRVFVAACGPESLMDAVKDSADDWRSKRGFRIDVHCEDFNG
ncbi:hypothetical protein CH063_03411 [Colletotrichum higginsianum]|uniref:FAD-binding FR-type domain-containing protein n=1 Tax=Colletotrichum higginsianum (strain IMI 349063) TaxID=759273 RepID=H1VWV9_COLHI|nr:hypothetical protein CH063_03411 [Colletotrichum higginsianum]